MSQPYFPRPAATSGSCWPPLRLRVYRACPRGESCEGGRRSGRYRDCPRRARARPHGRRAARGAAPLVELPFDPVRKRMTLVYDEGDGRYLYVKGAPEVVLDRRRCRRTKLPRSRRQPRWASRGLKVLAAAQRAPETSLSWDALEHDLTVVGLVALEDPRQDGSGSRGRGALSRVARGDDDGDHPLTAEAIGDALGRPRRRSTRV